MVKKTKYDHHPMMIVKGLTLGEEEAWGGIIYVKTESLLVALTGTVGDIKYSLFSLASLNPPKATIAAILDVEVNDSASAAGACYMKVAAPGAIIAAKESMCACPHVNDMVAGKLCIVELSEDFKFAYMVEASGANTLDYNIKVVGWILDPTKTRQPFPSQELKAEFVVNQ